jgi:hypothetical protein
MAISGHKQLATWQQYVKPSQDAVAKLMAATDPDRRRRVTLWVPKASSMSSDQAIFVDQATDASLPLDAVLIKIDRFG